MAQKLILTLFCLITGILGVYFEENFPVNSGFAKKHDGGETLEVTLDDRMNCGPNDTQPNNRHNTTTRVNNLIEAMNDPGYDAYIVPSADEHQDEYVAEADERRRYISGFTGSAGTAVVLSNGKRALWTDGRYFLQADEELDCNWLLMKDGEEGVPSITEWLIQEIPGGVASADARLIGADMWIESDEALSANAINFKVDAIDENGNDLLDTVWNDDNRPGIVNNPIYEHAVEFAGQTWQDKVMEMAASVAGYGGNAFIVTALDEIAWLLNLRGFDIPYNPVFQSYVIVDMAARDPPLLSLFAGGNLSMAAEAQLNINNCSLEEPCVSIMPYNDISDWILGLNVNTGINKIMISSAFSYSSGASYYIYNLVSPNKRILNPSPILFTKAKKNVVEQNGMRNAHIKDATALISFMAFIDAQITAGEIWTEITARDVLAEYRYDEDDNMGLSFETISAFGPNGAIIHYDVTDETDTVITDQNLYLVDSGGQYKDGTTDVTRTLHFGTPTDEQIEAYTRVFMGVSDFASLKIPVGTGKYSTDILARRKLYEVGWDYRHGTSHGVGMFLFVHESSDDVYELGFCGSDEPGYYEDGEFGVRIENVMMVVNTTTKYDFIPVSYTFETLTLVPYEKKLINITLLNEDHCLFLDENNQKIQEIMGPILQAKDQATYDYMMDKTSISCYS